MNIQEATKKALAENKRDLTSVKEVKEVIVEMNQGLALEQIWIERINTMLDSGWILLRLTSNQNIITFSFGRID